MVLPVREAQPVELGVVEAGALHLLRWQVTPTARMEITAEPPVHPVQTDRLLRPALHPQAFLGLADPVVAAGVPEASRPSRDRMAELELLAVQEPMEKSSSNGLSDQ